MLGGVDSEPGPLPGRQREIDTRLDAVRARLKKLRDRDWDAVKSRTAAPGERLEAAWRHAAEAHAAAAKMLASSAEAFRRAAEAHERVASVHERAAASGIGDVRSASGRQHSTGPLPPPTGSEPNVPSHFSPNPGGPGLPLSSMSHPTARPHNSTGPHWKPGNRCLTRHDQDLEAASSRVAARRRARRRPPAAADIQTPAVPIQTILSVRTAWSSGEHARQP